jgi:hypothetical protein
MGAETFWPELQTEGDTTRHRVSFRGILATMFAQSNAVSSSALVCQQTRLPSRLVTHVKATYSGAPQSNIVGQTQEITCKQVLVLI